MALRRIFWVGLLGAAAVMASGALRRPPPGPRPVRQAGRDQMRDPPREWDEVDERSDASFPASDPPGGY